MRVCLFVYCQLGMVIFPSEWFGSQIPNIDHQVKNSVAYIGTALQHPPPQFESKKKKINYFIFLFFLFFGKFCILGTEVRLEPSRGIFSFHKRLRGEEELSSEDISKIWTPLTQQIGRLWIFGPSVCSIRSIRYSRRPSDK